MKMNMLQQLENEVNHEQQHIAVKLAAVTRRRRSLKSLSCAS
jgi:hypothetical protein